MRSKLLQRLLGAAHHLARNACQLRHMDAVALVRATRHDLAQEDHLALLLGHGDVIRPHARQDARDLDQLMVVRGEERLRAAARVVVQILHDGAGDGQPVIGAGATPDLVQDHQAARRRVMQDVRRLDHLDHERALPGGEVVLRADAREDAVHQPDARRLRRDERADLRHAA